MAGLGSATGKGVGLGSTGYRSFQLPTMSPEQQSLFSQVMGGSQQGIGSGLSHLSNLAAGDQSSFQQMEAPALRQFGAIQGNMASRFTHGGGAVNGQAPSSWRNTSGFQNSLGEAGASLAENLASQRMKFQQDAIKQLLGLGSDLLNRDAFDTFLMPEEKKVPFWKRILGMGLPIAGGIGGTLLGGPSMGGLGANIGSSLGQSFL